MEAKTSGFRMLPSYYEVIRDLPDEERLALYDAVMDFGFGNTPENLSPILGGYLKLMQPSIQKSIKFEAKQKANGQKGGRPPSETQAKPKQNPDKTQNNPDETQSDFGENLAIAVAVDVANERDIESDIEKHADKPRRAARFTPPSVDEVRSYCMERHNHVDPQRFVNFYASKGWMVGKNKMRDWRAAVRTWEKGDQNGRDRGYGDQDQEIPGIIRL